MNTLIVDGSSLYARSFFAAASSSTQDLPGRQRNAIEISFRSVVHFLREERIPYRFDRTLFCWDGSRKNHKERAPKPSDYHPQRFDLMNALEKMLGAEQAEVDGEADDAVATAAYRAESEGDKVVIVSGDKDLTQIISSKVEYYCLNAKKILHRSDVLRKWKVKRPVQIPLALAILGDKVDNICGVPKYGPKKVEALFHHVTEAMTFSQAYETIRSLLPRVHRETFDECLDLTILDPDIKGIPSPSEIVLAPVDTLYDLGLANCSGDYTMLHAMRNGLELDDLLSEL